MGQKNPPQLTWRLIFVLISVAFGGWFAGGFSLAATNAPQNVIVQWIRSVQCSRYEKGHPNETSVQDNETQNAVTVWCRIIPEDQEYLMLAENPQLNTIWAIIGATVGAGALIAVWVTNLLISRFGIKKTLFLNNGLAFVAVITTGLSVTVSSYEMLIVGRIMLGMCIGISIAVTPLYITEISPISLRGTLGTVLGVFWVLGVLVVVVFGLPQVLGAPNNWIWLFWLRMVPVITLFISLPFCPESPRYLLLTKKEKLEARKALIWLRGTDDVQEELMLIQNEGDTSNGTVISVVGLFKDPFLRKCLTVCVMAILSQQVSGITAVIFYSTAIFSSAGLGRLEALYGTIGMMVLQVFATVAASSLMDRAGRRLLLLVGCIGSSITCAGMVLFMSLAKQGCEVCQYGSLACVLIFIVVFNLGPGFVPWMLVSEMFPQSSRGAAMIIVSTFCHGPSLLVAFFFPILQAQIDQWAFAMFAVGSLLFTVYLYYRVIETKGKTIDAIQKELREQFS